MKKLFALMAIVLAVVVSSCQYDDTMVWERFDDHENRITQLEELCREMNTNISALQSIVEALQNNDFVTSVTPVTEGGETIGYVITFSKSGTVTIYHGEDGADGKDGINGADGKDGVNGADGKDGVDGADGKDGINGTDGKDGADGADGKDGVTPTIGVRQDEDGIYYWTINGEWLTDDAGNKIKAVGVDGKDGVDGADGKDGINGTDGKDGVDGADGKDGINGADGKDGADAIAPQLKIENDYWWISTDGGLTWTQLGKAKGEDGVNYCEVFKGVSEDDDYVYFTLADDSTIAVLKDKEFTLELATEKFNYSLGYTYTIGYTITGATSATTLEVIGSNNLQPTIESYALNEGVATGEITVEMPKTIVPHATVAVLAGDGRSKVVMKAVHFYYEGNDDIEDGVLVITSGEALEFPKDGGVVEVDVQTNLSYRVDIPEEYSWLTVAETRASLREETLTFAAEANEGNPRHAFAYIIDLADNSIAQTLCFTQAADTTLMGEEVVFVDELLGAYMIKNFDTNQDGVLSKDEALGVANVAVDKNVADLTGLEWCTNLKSLSCASNSYLTALNTTPYAQLEELDISGSKITSLDLSNNRRLKRLIVYSSKLTALNVENNNELVTLKCYSMSNLANTTLTLNNHPYLEYLDCQKSKLTKLDIASCSSLQTLYCQNNSISKLDITNCRNLEILDCRSNTIEELNFANTTKLRTLDCSGNYMTKLNLSACMNLQYIYDQIYSYNELDLPYLRELNLGSIPSIKSLSIATIGTDELYTLKVSGECLTSLTVTARNKNINGLSLDLPNLKSLSITGYMGTEEDFDGVPNLKSLELSANVLTKLDMAKSPLLESLNITSAILLLDLNIANNKQLKSLFIGEAGVVLSAIDLSNNTELTRLFIGKATNLERLDLSNCLKLSYVSLSSIQSLSYINFGENPNYINVSPFDRYARGNGWEDLGATLASDLTIVAPLAESLNVYDVAANIKLDITGCPKLRSIDVEKTNRTPNDYGVTELDLSKQTDLRTLSVVCNNLDLDFDLRNHTPLTSIQIQGTCNTVNASNLKSVESISLGSCASVDISGCTALTSFEAATIKELDFSNCPNLRTFAAQCNFEHLNLSNMSQLQEVDLRNSPLLDSLDVSGCSNLSSLRCNHSPWLAAINLDGCTALSALYLSYCERLASIDLSDCTALKSLECELCSFTQLDVSYCSELTSLDCSPMSTLETLYVNATQNEKLSRHTNYIPNNTNIVVK